MRDGQRQWHEAEPRRAPAPGLRRRDVALAAGVSVATVSNVIHYPHLVAAETLERVQSVIQDLGFQPDLSPRALGRPRSSLPDPKQETVPGPENAGFDPEIIQPGIRLSLHVGPEALSGIVDAVMPDKSCFWIWVDGGMGRRMIDSRDALDIRTETNELPREGAPEDR